MNRIAPRRAIPCALVAAFVSVAPVAAQPCTPGWTGEFEGGTFNSTVQAAAVYDDGRGPALYVGGGFTTVNGVTAARILRWDGREWAALATGLPSTVQAMVVYDFDGAGPQPPSLVIAGSFTSAGGQTVNRIVRWDGLNWSPIGAGFNNTVNALAVYDSGSGPELYAGGAFTSSGGTGTARVARWNGTEWVTAGGGTDNVVNTLRVGTIGGVTSLYAGGTFANADGDAASRIARWDGSAWHPLGAGVGVGTAVNAIEFYNDGSGNALYAGGTFTLIGGVSANRVARWNGSAWSDVGGGVNGTVNALAVHNDGSGAALYVGGAFTSAGAVSASRAARWDGSSWSEAGGGLNSTVEHLLNVPSGALAGLYVGGSFTAGGLPSSSVGRMGVLRDGNWFGLSRGTDAIVRTAVVGGAGSSQRLYIGGDFSRAGSVYADRVAVYDGEALQALGDGLPGPVYALALHQGVGSPTEQLFAGGTFNAGGLSRIARWTGTAWDSVGGMNSTVFALRSFGGNLYAAGSFTNAGGITANRVARWNGTSWSALGSGVNNTVYALGEFDAGSGAQLYAAGIFTTADGAAANRIARWNGSNWLPLGDGVNGRVNAMVVHDDGSGPALFVGGQFTTAGAISANRVAKWTGSAWADLAGGVNGTVEALYVFDDGDGSKLYAAGAFTLAGGRATNRIARWTGVVWEEIGDGLNDIGYTLASWTGASGAPQLIVGGQFTSADGRPADRLAVYEGCDPCPADFNSDGAVNTADITAYLSAWFAARAGGTLGAADFNRDGAVNTADITAYLSAWFAARAGGC